MAFVPNDFHAFDVLTVFADAPAQSGVYGIFRQGTWIYVGESQDIRARLIQHLTDDDSADIRAQLPIGFTFELSPAASRVGRQNQLIAELHPICNHMMG